MLQFDSRVVHSKSQSVSQSIARPIHKILGPRRMRVISTVVEYDKRRPIQSCGN